MAAIPGTNGTDDDLVDWKPAQPTRDTAVNILDPKAKDLTSLPASTLRSEHRQPEAPSQGAMEAFISSRINSAGGRTMKPGGKAGFLFPSGPYKGMTLEQATEAARQEWSNMEPGHRDTWASKNVTGNRTSAETGGSSPAPFALDAPKFNGGQKVGRDGKPWGLGDMPSPTSSVARGGNSAPATSSEEAMLPKPTFAVTKNTASGPPAPGQVAKNIDGQYGTGSVTFGLPQPTARTGRIFDNGKDVTAQVMNSVASRQPATAVANNVPAPAPTVRPSKYPSPVDAASDAAMKTLAQPLVTPKPAAPAPYQTPPLTGGPDPRTHSPVSPFGAGAPPIATRPAPVPMAQLPAPSPHVINVGSAPGAQTPATQFRNAQKPPVTASSIVGNAVQGGVDTFVNANKQALGAVGNVVGDALNTTGNIALAPVGATKMAVNAVQKVGERAGELMNTPLTSPVVPAIGQPVNKLASPDADELEKKKKLEAGALPKPVWPPPSYTASIQAEKAAKSKLAANR